MLSSTLSIRRGDEFFCPFDTDIIERIDYWHIREKLTPKLWICFWMKILKLQLDRFRFKTLRFKVSFSSGSWDIFGCFHRMAYFDQCFCTFWLQIWKNLREYYELHFWSKEWSESRDSIHIEFCERISLVRIYLFDKRMNLSKICGFSIGLLDWFFMFFEYSRIKFCLCNFLSETDLNWKRKEYGTIRSFDRITIVIIPFRILSRIIKYKNIRRPEFIKESKIRNVVGLVDGTNHIIEQFGVVQMLP